MKSTIYVHHHSVHVLGERYWRCSNVCGGCILCLHAMNAIYFDLGGDSFIPINIYRPWASHPPCYASMRPSSAIKDMSEQSPCILLITFHHPVATGRRDDWSSCGGVAKFSRGSLAKISIIMEHFVPTVCLKAMNPGVKIATISDGLRRELIQLTSSAAHSRPLVRLSFDTSWWGQSLPEARLCGKLVTTGHIT